MGQQQSISQPKRRSHLRGRKGPWIPTKEEGDRVVGRMEEILSDPVYSSGVSSSSVKEMILDIAKVIAGESRDIRIPRPMEGVSPLTSMSVDDDSEMPNPLLSFSKPGLSRRTRVYNLGASDNVDALMQEVELAYSPNT